MDHAGHFPPQVQLKELNLLPQENSTHTLNNNSLTAQPHLEMKVAMEVLWTVLSNTLNKTHLNLNLTIHTPLLMEPANMLPQRELVKLLDSLMLHQNQLINLKQQLLLDQFQLLLKPTELYSNHTLLESSPADFAEPPLITESSLLDMELKTELTTS